MGPFRRKKPKRMKTSTKRAECVLASDFCSSGGCAAGYSCSHVLSDLNAVVNRPRRPQLPKGTVKAFSGPATYKDGVLEFDGDVGNIQWMVCTDETSACPTGSVLTKISEGSGSCCYPGGLKDYAV